MNLYNSHPLTGAARLRPAGLGLALCLAVVLLSACSHIDEDDRLIYEKPAPVGRAVLLEDFTGQRCTNCPKGTDIIEQLQEELGDSVFVAVGIHGGPLGFSGNARNIGLATPEGDTYFDYWKLEYQPVGLVNRHQPLNYTDWVGAVKDELARPATMRLTLDAVALGSEAAVTVRAYGTDGDTDGRLQVWLLEDGITALQLMPDGSANTDYVHNHVLRTPVNGLWGQEFSVREGEWQEAVLSLTLLPEWNVDRLSIVAFVYTADGVQQVVKQRLIVQ